MMTSLYSVSAPDALAQGCTADALFDELSRQLVTSDSMRRTSRGSSNGHRPGAAMRVVKPTSANNSPRTSMMARRRTFMNDVNLARRRQQVLDQSLQMPVGFNPYEVMPEPTKPTTSRPVSWHPSSSHMQIPQAPPQQQPQFIPHQYPQYVMPTPLYSNELEAFPAFQQPFPPTPAAYSQQASPSAAFSPLSLPVQGVSQSYCQPIQQGTPADAWQLSTQHQQHQTYQIQSNPSPEFNLPQPILPEQNYAATNYPSIDWNYFAPQGFNNSTAPPTPDQFPTVQPSEPTVPIEETIPYKALEEPEEEGEILVGMGLYDTPDKTDEDPELDNYRSSTSQLLGTTYRRGKGLKLEEAWEPPASDEEDNDQEDAEADDQEEDSSSEEKEATENQSERQQGNWI